MITVNLKIELSNLDKAMTEIEALKNMVLDLSNTYPTTFKTPPAVEEEEVVSEAPTTKPKRKRRSKAEIEAEKTVEKVPPAKEEAEAEELGTMTLEALTELAKSVVKAGFRDEAKALIAEYSTSGKLSSVPTDKYETLASALKTL